MKCLLDVNVLLAAIWSDHPHHEAAFEWLEDKNIVLCPISELGFLRISTNPKATINAPMAKARDLLQRFSTERKAMRIDDDLPALESHAATSQEVTDHYLGDLANRHGLKLATFDSGIFHPSVVLISESA